MECAVANKWAALRPQADVAVPTYRDDFFDEAEASEHLLRN